MIAQRFLAALACVVLLGALTATAAAAPVDQPVRVQPFDPGDGPAQVAPPTPLRAPSGAAATINVPADYATIQGAIDAATSGDVIVVAAGTYAEAILIDAKNLTIQGAGVGSSIITGTGAETQYIVRITNAAVVDFSGFTVDGTGLDRDYGIYADAGSDGDIHDNEVKNVSKAGALGIAIRRQECYIDVTNNDVYGFGRIGIYTRDDVIGNTDTGVISGNTVTGLAGLDPARLSYGISVYSGNPTIDGNDIYDCISGANVAQWASAGLDPWTGGAPIVSNNNFYNCEYGILSNSASPVMSGNTFTGTIYDDVRLDYFVKGNPTPHWAEYYDTIQDAIDAIPTASGYPVIVWIGIYSGGGTYAEAVHVDESCHIWGDSRATVVLNPAGLSYNNAGVYIDADGVLLSGFTLQSNGSNPPRYGVKFGDYDGCYLDDCEISGLYRTGVDILGATNLEITNVESHDNGGNGLQMVDATNVLLQDITTYNNSWGGVGIFTWGQYTPIGVSGVVFSGTNSFGETSQPDVGSIYLEEGNYSNPASPHPITWSTDIGDGADVTLQLADVTHMLTGNSDNDNDYQRFYATLGDVQAAATVAVSHILDGRYYVDIPGAHVYVPGNASYLGSIQGAVDAADPGDTVHIAAGTFEEQVEVAKSLTLDGEGVTTVILSPVTLTEKYTTSVDNYPVVYVHDADPVVIQDLLVDGAGRGNANYRFNGVAFRNAGGGIYNCDLKDVRDTPFSGSQHGVALYVYNDDTVTRTMDVQGCNFYGFQKNAMALNAAATTQLVVDVSGNTVTGYGATDITAQNGIQVWGDINTGTISGNTVTDIAYDNTAAATKWVASSILNYYADVDITGNTVGGEAHVGVYNIDGSGAITGNTIGIQKIGVYAFGIIATDPPSAVPSPYMQSESGPQAVAPPQRASMAALNVDVSGNDVSFTGPDNTATYGIEADAGWGPNDIAVTANNNTVDGFEVGLEFYQCQSGCDTGVFTGITANYNDVSGNSLFGMRSNASYLTANGLHNWWGDASGPYEATANPLGAGVPVSPYIDFDPWLTAPSIVSVDPVAGVTNCGTPITFAVRLDHAGVAPEVRGFDVDLTIPTTYVGITNPTFGGDFTEGTVLNSVGGTYFAAVDQGGGTWKVSGAILGGTTGSTLSGELFTVTLTPTSAEGTGSVDLANLLLRDPNNVPLAGDVVGGTVQVDCTAPTMEAIAEAENECYNAAPTFANFGFDDDANLDYAEYTIDAGSPVSIFSGIDAVSWDDDGWMLGGFGALSEGAHTVTFYVYDDAGNVNSPVTTWSFIKDTTPPDPPTDFVALPGHNKTHLSWTNPVGDASFVGVEIRVVAWGDYPEYITAPSYPANETEGTLVTQTAAASYDDDPRTPRDIYYYAAFSYDCAGNYSVLGPTAKDRTTSYWLGDIRPTPGWDGNVNITDLAAFSAAFGTGDGDAGWDNEADFGPTDDFSRFGIPLPDDAIQFEDLMIFAMNYGNVGPAGVSRPLASSAPALEDQVGVRLVHKSTDGNISTYALVLDNNAEVLKGVSVSVDIGAGNEMVEARASSNGRRSNIFFGTVAGEHGQIDLCAAALGVNVPLDVSGEIAEIQVRHAAVQTPQVFITGGELRDLENRGTTVSGSKPGGTPFVPTVSAMFQNHPNPFNPITTITFDVATPGVVTIRIFDVSGRLVRTVTDGFRPQGRHSEVWDGRDDRGNAVHSGIYFYRMDAPGFRSPTKKMLLLK
jgi:hypothetical protein